ncbi:MAG: hypothetical protein RIR11_2202 [Bacteroidota bacterium]|jgi:hypothetical protein
MKHILFCLLFLGTAFTAQSQDRWLYWKYKDYDGGMNFTVPRLAIGAGSVFLKEKGERQMLRRLHKVRTLIFEDGSPLSGRDLKRFGRKAKRNGLEEIVTVREGKMRVQIMAKNKGTTLKKVVVFVNDPEDGFFMISIKGKLKITDVNKLLKKYNKKGKPIKTMIPEFAGI